jgi:hypothetical protein
MFRGFRGKLLAHLCLAALDLLAIEGLLRLDEVRWGLPRCLPGSYAAPGKGPRVVFVGDSTMVGTNVPTECTMPSSFLAIAREAGVEPCTVWNFARPGGIVASAVEDAVAAIQSNAPTAIVLRAGGIDSVVADAKPLPRPSPLRIADAIRRCAVVVRGIEEPQETRPEHYQVPVGPRAAELPSLGIDLSSEIAWMPTDIIYQWSYPCSMDELAKRVIERLRPLADAAHRAGVPVWLIGYLQPGGFLGPANVGLRRASAELGLRFVDVERVCAPVFDLVAYDELIYSDGHPRAIAYGIEARALFEDMAPTLGLSRAADTTPKMWLSDTLARMRRLDPNFVEPLGPRVELETRQVDSGIVCEIRGHAGAQVWLIVGKRAPPWDYFGWQVPIDRDQAVAAGAAGAMHLELNDVGFKRIALSQSWVRQLGDETLVVACVSWTEGDIVHRSVSDIVGLVDGKHEPLRRP